VITVTEASGYVYRVPEAGSFYVPPRYQEFVASLAPAQGDFAEGARRDPSVGHPVLKPIPR
jgi:hypothetical protein